MVPDLPVAPTSASPTAALTYLQRVSLYLADLEARVQAAENKLDLLAVTASVDVDDLAGDVAALMDEVFGTS